DASLVGVRLLAVEDDHQADRSGQAAARAARDLLGERGALFALGLDSHLDQLVALQAAVDLAHGAGAQALAADVDQRFERMGETAQALALGRGELALGRRRPRGGGLGRFRFLFLLLRAHAGLLSLRETRRGRAPTGPQRRWRAPRDRRRGS